MDINLESLGMTTECLANRVVEAIANKLLHGIYDDESHFYHSGIEKGLKEFIVTTIHERINAVAHEIITPAVDKMIEGVIIQETNKYGEIKGEVKTFKEFMCGKAEDYLMEPVDDCGRTQAECQAQGRRWYKQDKNGTRIMLVVNEYLGRRVDEAMKESSKSLGAVLIKSLDTSIRGCLKTMAEEIQIKLSMPK